MPRTYQPGPLIDSTPLGFPKDAAALAAIADDWTVWALGDVHGCLDPLRLVLTRAGLLDSDAHWAGGARVALVGVGDYIDRGPDSAGVVAFLRKLADEVAAAGSRLILLRGNHEQMLADVLRGSDAWFLTWLTHGGVDCAKSYGVQARNGRAHRPGAEVRADLQAAAPDLLPWLLTTLPYAVWRDVLFVHAGLVDGGDVTSLSDSDLQMWDPGPYYKSKGLAIEPAYSRYRADGIGRVVVGHSPRGLSVRHGGTLLMLDANAGPANPFKPEALAIVSVPPVGPFVGRAIDRSATVVTIAESPQFTRSDGVILVRPRGPLVSPD
jgi:hypothetical protein